MLMTKLKPLQPHELSNLWYSVLNHVDEEGYQESLRWVISLAQEEGHKLDDLINYSEAVGGMIQSMCYDALRRGGKPITEQQLEFLKDHPWQKEFWG
jgi:hypothetical protein